MTNKERIIEWISKLPDDIQVFKTDELADDCVEIKIFLKPKTKEFLTEYFGP